MAALAKARAAETGNQSRMMSQAAETPTTTSSIEASSLSPFRYLSFTVLWVATVVSNIGTWMQNAAAGWLMTSLDPDPFVVSMVQVATSLPLFLFALPAGALADIVDRRPLLTVINVALTCRSRHWDSSSGWAGSPRTSFLPSRSLPPRRRRSSCLHGKPSFPSWFPGNTSSPPLP
jgi:hypothetical protein